MGNEKKPSLLQKYNIPIDHLDFGYIKKCQNAKEMEKIVEILVSGEEGYYPDLTTCAENKLKELNPNSRVLRIEEPIKREQNMANKEWNDISNMMKDFTCNIKKDSTTIRSSPLTNDIINEQLPAVRIIDNPASRKNKSESKTNRIRSCDYSQWDKYDADTEELKLDLIEERNREQNEIKHKKRIEEISNDTRNPIAEHLTGVEKEKLAEKYRMCGNEFFRSSDYDDAIVEYTKSIQIVSDARCYNNRAMAYIKLKKFKEAIKDCDECLKREPENVKALLRKGESLLKEDNIRNAYETYLSVVKVEPDNKTAAKYISDLRKRLPELPPPDAFRLNISENGPEAQAVVQTKLKKTDIPADDLSKLVIPKRIVKSKISKMASNLSGLAKSAKDDLKKVKDNYERKKGVEIFPRAHDESWKGAFIEEVK